MLSLYWNLFFVGFIIFYFFIDVMVMCLVKFKGLCLEIVVFVIGIYGFRYMIEILIVIKNNLYLDFINIGVLNLLGLEKI